MRGQGLTRPRRVVAIDQMRMIDRNCEIPHEGPFCDLMWSDPEDIETWAISPRGAGWLFGSRVTAEFNEVRPRNPQRRWTAALLQRYTPGGTTANGDADFLSAPG